MAWGSGTWEPGFLYMLARAALLSDDPPAFDRWRDCDALGVREELVDGRKPRMEDFEFRRFLRVLPVGLFDEGGRVGRREN